jgi:hypothetical protein
MTVDVAVDAEIVEPLDRESAERLDRRIRLLVGTIHDQMAKLDELVAKAKRGNVHAALGFPSWTAYLTDVFTVDVRLERQQRRELVAYLSGEGMSQRAIADVVGASKGTVYDDLKAGAQNRAPEPGPEASTVTGLDGKKYKRKPVDDDVAPVDAGPRRHGNSTVQIRALKNVPRELRYMADVLETVFTGTFDKTCTPDIAHHAAQEMRTYIARINKVLLTLESHG